MNRNVSPLRLLRRALPSTVVAMVLCLTFAACGDSGPGADDVKSSLNNFLNAFFGPVSPLNNHMIVLDMKNVSCTADSGGATYACTYDRSVRQPSSAPVDQPQQKGRFSKASGAWAILQPGG